MPSVQVRYIVHDVAAAIPFYTEQLGFKLEMHPAPAFAMLSRNGLRLVLSSPNRVEIAGAHGRRIRETLANILLRIEG